MAGKRCYVRSTEEILHELIAAERDQEKGSPLVNAVESSYRIHLFWDDADKLKPTEFNAEALFSLIDKIYKHDHGLTVTSNKDLVGIQDVLRREVVRRIDDICHVVEV
jgi:DNA replication protein DnaC